MLLLANVIPVSKPASMPGFLPAPRRGFGRMEIYINGLSFLFVGETSQVPNYCLANLFNLTRLCYPANRLEMSRWRRFGRSQR